MNISGTSMFPNMDLVLSFSFYSFQSLVGVPGYFKTTYSRSLKKWVDQMVLESFHHMSKPLLL